MRDAVVVTLLAVMVVLAGCGGQLTDQSADPTQTTESPTGSQTTEVSVEDVSFPDGFDENGVTDVARALDTHWAAAERAGTYASRLSGTTRTNMSENSTIEADIYVGDGAGYLRERQGGEETYDAYRSDLHNSTIIADALSFPLEDVMVAETFEFEEVTVRSGTTLLVYESDDLDLNASLYDYYEGFTVTSHDATLVVDADGRIRSFQTSTAMHGEEGWLELDIGVTFSEYGTAERPDWTGEAEGAATTQAGEPARAHVVSGVANVTASETVDYVNLTVMRSAGGGDLDLSMAAVEWVGPNSVTTLTYGTDSAGEAEFGVVPIADDSDSAPVLDEQSDRFRIVIDVTGPSGEPLRPGQEAQLKLTTARGAVTVYQATIPESLDGETTVTV